MPLQAKQSFAFQGELGAFSHSAGMKLLGSAAEPVPRTTFREVFEALKADEVSFALLPIENTLHGSVHENYDHLLNYDFPVIGELSLRISHQLITMPGVSMEEVRKVFSHPVALNQCRTFFERNSHIQPVPFYDTAGSVKMLQQENPAESAAIASDTAAAIYGGVVRQPDIEDDPQNFTRFFLLSKQSSAATRLTSDPAKTSLVFSTANQPGALFKAMACFALRDISLTKIESRPLRGKPWEYLFYVDLLGSTEDRTIQNALGHLKELTDFLKVLGSYRPAP